MQTQPHPIVLFDGVCNFCNASVNFIIRHDKQKRLRFATLQSEAGERIRKEFGIADQKPDSFLLLHKGHLYKYTEAALKVFNMLPWYWKWTQVIWLIPQFVRDPIYRLIAKNRYKWFGKKEECMIPSPEVKERFLS